MELSFCTGDIIQVYGDMDDDGFYIGEIGGARGLVPSNFLAEAPPQVGENSARKHFQRKMRSRDQIVFYIHFLLEFLKFQALDSTSMFYIENRNYLSVVILCINALQSEPDIKDISAF